MSQLAEPIALFDIADVEGFVNATLNASGIDFQTWEREDLVAEGLVILFELARRFEPHRAGYASAGRFSGFAACYLPKKLGDAWHRNRPEHRYVTGEDGKRRWQFFKAHASIQGTYEDRTRGLDDVSGDRADLVDGQFLDARYWVPVAAVAQPA